MPSGYLMKRTADGGGVKPQFFVLRGGTLKIYKTRSDAEQDVMPCGSALTVASVRDWRVPDALTNGGKCRPELGLVFCADKPSSSSGGGGGGLFGGGGDDDDGGGLFGDAGSEASAALALAAAEEDGLFGGGGGAFGGAPARASSASMFGGGSGAAAGGGGGGAHEVFAIAEDEAAKAKFMGALKGSSGKSSSSSSSSSKGHSRERSRSSASSGEPHIRIQRACPCGRGAARHQRQQW